MVIIGGDNKVIIELFLVSIIHLLLIRNKINTLINNYKTDYSEALAAYVKSSIFSVNVRCLCHI